MNLLRFCELLQTHFRGLLAEALTKCGETDLFTALVSLASRCFSYIFFSCSISLDPWTRG